MCRLELGVVFNLRKGPFKKSSHHRVVVAAGIEFFEEAGPQNLLFQILYPHIAFDLGLDADSDHGTQEHMISVWLKLKGTWAESQKQGDFLNMSRWFAWEVRAHNFIVSCGGPAALLMVLTWVGFRRGWWRSIGETTLVGWASQEVPADHGDYNDEATDRALEQGVEAARPQESPRTSGSDPGIGSVPPPPTFPHLHRRRGT